ncbi:MAG: CcdC family protein [Bacilli bacterium]
MPALSNQTLQIVSTVIIVVGAIAVIFIRLHAARKPTSARKILIPPLGMATGFLMFIVPLMRIPLTYAIIAFLFGGLFSIPLITTSKMLRQDGDVYLKRSPAFIIVLLALLVIRLALHTFIEQYITVPQTGAIFFILAFGMLLPWRLVMYGRYRKFVAQGAGDPSRRHATES